MYSEAVRLSKNWPIRFRLMWLGLRTAYWVPRTFLPDVYSNDALLCFNSHAFMEEPAFKEAYQRGVRALGGEDFYHWEWRFHIGLWAAESASRLEGDFVECGVSHGFLSSAVMQHLKWDSLGKTFYLLDTFEGMDPRFITDIELQTGALEKNQAALDWGMYANSADRVRANFAEWEHQRIIVGPVPDTLDQVDAQKVAYLHLDMNCAPPEIAALRFFWPRLVPGAFVLLDDYAQRGRDEQRLAMDEAARDLGVSICTLPTGQGLVIKPPN